MTITAALPVFPCKHQSTRSLRFKERVLQTPNDLLVAGFEEHKFRNFFNAVSHPGCDSSGAWADRSVLAGASVQPVALWLYLLLFPAGEGLRVASCSWDRGGKGSPGPCPPFFRAIAQAGDLPSASFTLFPLHPISEGGAVGRLSVLNL